MDSTAGGFTKGYLSEEHKKKFTITAGILGGVFFVGQFIIPMILMIIAMPVMMFQKGFFKEIEIERAELWENAIWYVESAISFSDTAGTSVLKRLALDGEEEPEEIASLPEEQTWLLGSPDRLWIITDSDIGWYKDGAISRFPNESYLGSFDYPFLYEGHPAIIEDTPDYFQLRVYKNEDWHAVNKVYLGTQVTTADYCARTIRIFPENGVYHVFMAYSDKIYYRQDIPFTEGDKESWNVIGHNQYKAVPAIIQRQPVLFKASGAKGGTMSREIQAMGRNARGRWEAFATIDAPLINEFAVFPIKGKEYVVVMNDFPGGITVIHVDWDTPVKEMHYGQRTMFPPSFMAIMFIPYLGNIIAPLLLALILTSLIRKHKVTEFESEGQRKPFAPLIKRAFAQIIDAIVVGLPFAIGYATMFSWFINPAKMFTSNMLNIFWLFLGGAGWGILCFFVFSYLEGRYGKTPGKWVLGIQVLGTDLTPCGFGRALIRNILTFVDGFFNFMVGVMIIALHENWQRIGDMAARTVVIDNKLSTKNHVSPIHE